MQILSVDSNFIFTIATVGTIPGTVTVPDIAMTSN